MWCYPKDNKFTVDQKSYYKHDHDGTVSIQSGPCKVDCKWCKEHIVSVHHVKPKLVQVVVYNDTCGKPIIGVTGQLHEHPVKIHLKVLGKVLFIVEVRKQGIYALGFGSKVSCKNKVYYQLKSKYHLMPKLGILSITSNWLWDKLSNLGKV